MTVFAHEAFAGHEDVVFVSDRATSLRAIIAIHDTRRGPALGGCRFHPYAGEDEALHDVLRLSRSMSYKSALAGLALGGGKSVIIGDLRTDKSPRLLQAFARAIERLGGRYIVAEDVGTTPADMTVMRAETRHVAGLVDGGCGDPAPMTAHGVHEGMLAAARHRLGAARLEGRTVAVQGLGSVGWALCQRLAADGARLTVADVRNEAVERARRELGANATEVDRIYDAPADIFAPCAMGGILNDQTIPRLLMPIVAGSANNQLAEDRHGAMLRQRDILYAPDYAINAGGIIAIAHEDRQGGGFDRQAATAAIGRIFDRLEQIFRTADAEGLPTSIIADRMAEQRLAEVT